MNNKRSSKSKGIKPENQPEERRKQADEALVASEVRYRRLFETAKDGIIILDAKTGQIMDVNKFLIDLLGFSHEQFLGKKIWEIGFFKDIISNRKNFAELQRQKYIRYGDMPLETTRGKRIDVEFVSNVYSEGNKDVIQCNIRNITDRKQKEAKIRRFATILQDSNDAITISDFKGRITAWNHGAELMYGYSEEEALKMNIWQITPPDKVAEKKEFIRRLTAGETITSFETQRKTKDKRTLDVWLTVTKLIDDAGNPIGIASTERDMTKRKQEEEQLKQSESKCRTIFDSANDGILLADIETKKFFDGNKSICRMLGYTIEELKNLSIMDIHPKESVPFVVAQFEKQLRKEIDIAANLPVKRKDGSVFYADINASPLKLGNKEYLLGIFRDITKHKQQEEELAMRALLLDNETDSIFLHDLEGKFIYANKAAYETRGYTKEEFMSLPLSKLDTPEYARLIKSRVDKLLKGERLLFEAEHICKDGSLMPVEVHAAMIETNGKKLILASLRDISKSKKAEDELKKFSSAVEQTADIVIITDKEGVIQYVNSACEKLLGYTKKEIVGQTPRILKSGKQDKKFYQKLWQTVLSGNTFRTELVNRKKNGDLYYEEKTITPLKNQQGVITHFVSLGKDITERKRMENKLSRESEKYRVLVETTGTGYVIINQTGNVLDANPEYVRLSGHRDLSEIQGRCVTEWTADYEKKKNANAVAQCARDGYIRNFEIDYVDPNGKITPIEINATVVSTAGETQILTLCRDITERKKSETDLKDSETRFKTLFNFSSDAIMMIAPPDWKFIGCNPATIKMFKAKDEQEFTTKGPWDVSPEKQPDGKSSSLKAKQMIEEAMKTGRNLFEWTHKRLDGEDFYADVLLTRTEIGGKELLQATVRDITAHKKLEEQLFNSQRMEGIGKFSGYIAHDFNNIISVISGYAGMILEDLSPDSPLRNDVEEIRKAGERATGLTRQLLAFSRSQKLTKQVKNLNPIIADIEKMLHRLIGEDIKLTFSFDAGLHQVNVDPGQIEQVIMNLVINARDAMPEGGKITLRTKNTTIDEWAVKLAPESKTGSFVCLSIQDTGIGIDKDILPHIFEPFFTTKADGKGTGLGLSVCYGIVKQHDGWINVYSEKGKGTILNIYLPAVACTVEGEETIKKKSSPVKHKGSGERILILEDEPKLREFICRTLKNNGYAVFSAETAKEALDIFKKEKHDFDLLFTDAVLPDSSGLLIANKLLALKPGLKVIFTSGYMNGKSQQSAIDEKGYKFLQKPYPTDVLLQTIKETIQK